MYCCFQLARSVCTNFTPRLCRARFILTPHTGCKGRFLLLIITFKHQFVCLCSNFLGTILEIVVKRHRFCMHCIPFIFVKVTIQSMSYLKLSAFSVDTFLCKLLRLATSSEQVRDFGFVKQEHFSACKGYSNTITPLMSTSQPRYFTTNQKVFLFFKRV